MPADTVVDGRFRGKSLDAAEHTWNLSGAGETAMFEVGSGDVVKGLDQGVQRMQVGERAMVTMTPAFGFGEVGTPNGSRKESRRSARRLSVGPTGSFLVFDVRVVGIVGESASAGEAIASGGQHALRDSDAFDELLANGFVVETKEEGSGKKRRPRKGDVVQVTVETYVSLVLCVCLCVSVCACVRVCVCVDCSRSASRSPSLLSTLNPPSGVGPQYETVHESGINASRQGRGWKVSW